MMSLYRSCFVVLMKGKLGLPIIAVIVLATAVRVGAQGTTISKGEFETAISAAYAKTATRHRREVTNATKFVSGKALERELTTQDFAPPDKERWIILSTTPEKRTEIEVVYIGDVEYRRENKGEWKKSAGTGPNFQFSAATDLPKSDARTVVTYLSQETKDASGMRLRVFTERLILPPSVQTRTFTVDPEGLILRIEELTTEGAPDNILFKSLVQIAYSSHPVKIEAPIK